MHDTLENWQSEFLQLIWQVAGLALLYHIGSPQSNEGNDRLEEKIDLILQSVAKYSERDIERLGIALRRSAMGTRHGERSNRWWLVLRISRRSRVTAMQYTRLQATGGPIR